MEIDADVQRSIGSRCIVQITKVGLEGSPKNLASLNAIMGTQFWKRNPVLKQGNLADVRVNENLRKLNISNLGLVN